MKRADKVIGGAVALLLLVMVSAPANAQLNGFMGGNGTGGGDMMTQMAPMLEMMKARMGKRRFAALMQTMGPMMSQMMQNGGGFGGMGGDIGGYMDGGYGMGGMDMASMMGMIAPLMSMANLGGGHRHHRHH